MNAFNASDYATAIRFVLAQRALGSQIIDNLNASIHIHALLTHIFLLDEAFEKLVWRKVPQSIRCQRNLITAPPSRVEMRAVAGRNRRYRNAFAHSDSE